jgi:hypothetical protein
LTPQEEAEFDRLERAFTLAHYDALEGELFLWARVTGWTGDPFQVPARVVLNIARRVLFPPPREVPPPVS